MCLNARAMTAAWHLLRIPLTFPLGLEAFHAAVGRDKTIWAHNGMWTQDSPYRTKYAFATGDGQATPPQGPALWQHLFSQNSKWGLSTIKQDHIRQQVAHTKTSYTNVTVLKEWMAGMGEAATDNNIGVLYCCAEPNIHMNGVQCRRPMLSVPLRTMSGAVPPILLSCQQFSGRLDLTRLFTGTALGCCRTKTPSFRMRHHHNSLEYRGHKIQVTSQLSVAIMNTVLQRMR